MSSTIKHPGEDIEDQVAEAASILGLDVSRETLAAVRVYVEQLLKWNKTYNLTAIRNQEDVLVNHIFDCMSVLKNIREKTGNNKFKLVDVGSGAGLPGVIIGLWFPESQVICIDSVEKKVSFIRHVTARMGCKNVSSKHARVELIPPLEADVVISRAFASLSLFTSLAGKHCKTDGRVASMKAAQVKEDLAELETSGSEWCLDELQDLKVPKMMAKRYLVWLQRKGNNG